MALVWTLAIAPLTWVRLVTSSALQSRKWRLIGMNQWCRSALCGHSLPALTDNWTHGAAIRHTIPPISHTRPSPRSRSYYSFSVPLRVGGWVGLGKDRACIELRSKNNMRVQFSLSVHFYLLYLLLNSCDGNDALDWRFSMLVKQSSSLISPDLCPPNRPVDYRICGLMQELCITVYKHLSAIPAVVTSDLKQRLIDTLASIITKRHRRSSWSMQKAVTCKHEAKWHHFEHLPN